jgi:four helix bundle protein
MEESKFVSEFKGRLYKFTLRMIEFIDKLPADNVSRRIGDQLIRSCTSVIANYTEGRSASSAKDFINYLNIALKSANESKLWFALLRDSGRVKNETTVWLLAELNEISNILAASILTLKNKNKH